jgi:hypothetical protein
MLNQSGDFVLLLAVRRNLRMLSRLLRLLLLDPTDGGYNTTHSFDKRRSEFLQPISLSDIFTHQARG